MDLASHFPLCDQPGGETSNVDTKQMQEYARNQSPMEAGQLQALVENHAVFLREGGAGGSWSMFSAGGISFGGYRMPSREQRINTQQQANLNLANLSGLSLQEIQLPYSSWCGVYAKSQDFSDAYLEGCVFCDAMLDKSIFADANLTRVDFSRASLRHVSFMNAVLIGADFENCDLSGADFRGAILTGARFPGATLTNVRY